MPVPPVEHRWKPGKSGNPGGRPAFKGISRTMRRLLRASPERLVEAVQEARTVQEQLAASLLLHSMAAQGHSQAKLVLDRLEGPVEQRVHNTGDVGPAVIIEVVEAKAPQGDGDAPEHV